MDKVCHITSAHTRYDVRITQKECASLYENGYDVTLIVNDALPNEQYRGVNIISTGLEINGKRERIESLKKIYKLALDTNSQLYHLHDPELLTIALKLKKKGKKVIFDSHEYYSEQIKVRPYGKPWLLKVISKVYYLYETHVCKIIDGIIIPSEKISVSNEIIFPFKNRCKRICYVANYPKKIDFTPKEKNGSFKVCYAGGITPIRGIEALMDGCFLVGAKLVLAGKFESKEFEHKIRNKKSFSIVDYRGSCTLEEVYEIYSEANAGAATLLKLGQYAGLQVFPTKVYEYFQLKLPVIITDIPYNRRINEDLEYGVLVDPADANDIASAINYLKNNDLKAKQMGENGYKLYLKDFNWDNEEKKLFHFYNEILEEF